MNSVKLEVLNIETSKRNPNIYGVSMSKVTDNTEPSPDRKVREGVETSSASKDDRIECPVCRGKYASLLVHMRRTHNITKVAFNERWPNFGPTISKSSLQKMRDKAITRCAHRSNNPVALATFKKKISASWKTEEHVRRCNNISVGCINYWHNTEDGKNLRKLLVETKTDWWYGLSSSEKVVFSQHVRQGCQHYLTTVSDDDWNARVTHTYKKLREWWDNLSDAARAEHMRRASNRHSYKEASLVNQLLACGYKVEPQASIDGRLVDGYIAENNLVVEFDGCYWHGCDCIFNDENMQHPSIKATIKEIRARNNHRIITHNQRNLLVVSECFLSEFGITPLIESIIFFDHRPKAVLLTAMAREHLAGVILQGSAGPLTVRNFLRSAGEDIVRPGMKVSEAGRNDQLAEV